jgi:hypothetical protein
LTENARYHHRDKTVKPHLGCGEICNPFNHEPWDYPLFWFFWGAYLFFVLPALNNFRA